ncbi:NRDE family protein [Thioalkalivibrio sp. HK1]|uniref:NRDE family protein n=1 Tax=Thioalkalivibrio sp. HK1 TaxID=1469245 RepID=UPI000472638F|nr:NRDE family protein [Thioalkalivibrio sp. HK1]
MCLIYLAWRAVPRFDLIVAANRDEWHARRAAPAAWWEDIPGVLAGRDLQQGGTWMGVARPSDTLDCLKVHPQTHPQIRPRIRFSAITNYRELPLGSSASGHELPVPKATPAFRSRGELVLDFLAGGEGGRERAFEYSNRIHHAGHHYRGFGLLAMDEEDLCFVSNRGSPPRCLAPGVYGLSNHLLDTPWPKVVQGKEEMRRLLRSKHFEPHDFFSLLTSREIAPDASLPDTGIGIERERFLSSRFIEGDDYGTRASTLLFLEGDGSGLLIERRFRPRGSLEDERVFRISK